MNRRPFFFFFFLFYTAILVSTVSSASTSSTKDESLESKNYTRHTNNWAVIVDTSRFWFNYRHVANALSFYHTVKRLGIPDGQIILMLADGMPCNARNCFPGQVFNSHRRDMNLYGTDVEVDYRGNEVSVENFIRVLTGRHDPDTTPASRRLDSDEHSNVFVYLTGHGGDEFLKFQDFEELASHDLADAFGEMHEKRRYHELLFMVDTCQAGSLANDLRSPHVISIGSSQVGENSYAEHSDSVVGVSLIDRFTSATLNFMELRGDQSSMRELFDHYRPAQLHSTPSSREDLYTTRSLADIPLTDFFGSRLRVTMTPSGYVLTESKDKTKAKAMDTLEQPSTTCVLPKEIKTSSEGWNPSHVLGRGFHWNVGLVVVMALSWVVQ